MARSFDDASSQCLRASWSAVTAPPFSMAIWFRCTGTSYGVMSIGLDSNDHHHSLLLTGAGTVLAMTQRDEDWNNYATSSATFTADVWQHACGTWASTAERHVYLNGGNKGDNSNSCTNPTVQDIALAERVDQYSDKFTGDLAEAAIWNVVLTDAEVAILGAGYSPLFVRPQSLVAYWPLIRDPDIDIVGRNSLTPINTPGVSAHPRILHPAVPSLGIAAPSAGVSIPVLYYHYAHH
jgi:hypothetical protein